MGTIQVKNRTIEIFFQQTANNSDEKILWADWTNNAEQTHVFPGKARVNQVETRKETESKGNSKVPNLPNTF